MLQPVQYWDASDASVSAEDEQKLITYFHNQLQQVLQKNFTLVSSTGAGRAGTDVALINATTATPVLRSVSVVIPQTRLLNSLQSLATGSYAFVGSAEAEMKGVDGATGEFLAGAVDQRSGGIALSTAAQWQWGDAERDELLVRSHFNALAGTPGPYAGAAMRRNRGGSEETGLTVEAVAGVLEAGVRGRASAIVVRAFQRDGAQAEIMCGIAGVMMRDGRAPDPAIMERLTAAMVHRGPDGSGGSDLGAGGIGAYAAGDRGSQNRRTATVRKPGGGAGRERRDL